MAKVTSSLYKNCELNEADFVSANLQEVRFSECRMSQVDITEVRLKNVDLRSSQIDDIQGVGFLRGATIDAIQLMTLAPEFALFTGVKIK